MSLTPKRLAEGTRQWQARAEGSEYPMTGDDLLTAGLRAIVARQYGPTVPGDPAR